MAKETRNTHIKKLISDFIKSNPDKDIVPVICGGFAYNASFASQPIDTDDFDIKFTYREINNIYGQNIYNNILLHDEKSYINNVTQIFDDNIQVFYGIECRLYKYMMEFLRYVIDFINKSDIIKTSIPYILTYECMNNFRSLKNNFNEQNLATLCNLIMNNTNDQLKNDVRKYISENDANYNTYIKFCQTLIGKAKESEISFKNSSKHVMLSCCSGPGLIEITEFDAYLLRFNINNNKWFATNSLIECKYINDEGNIADLFDCSIFSPLSFLSKMSMNSENIFSYDMLKNSLKINKKSVVEFMEINENGAILYYQSPRDLLYDSMFRIHEKCGIKQMDKYSSDKMLKYLSKLNNIINDFVNKCTQSGYNNNFTELCKSIIELKTNLTQDSDQYCATIKSHLYREENISDETMGAKFGGRNIVQSIKATYMHLKTLG